MEKHLILRSPGQNLPFFVVLAGSVKDGQFVPSDDTVQEFIDFIDTPVADCIQRSELMGGAYVVPRADLDDLLDDYYHSVYRLGIEIYDGFIVLKFDGSYEGKEETAEKE